MSVRTLLLGAACAASFGTSALAERGADGELRVLYWQAASLLNPYLSTGAKDVDPASMVIEPLAVVGDDGILIPVLAAEIPSLENGGIAADYTSVTWKLKPDLEWSDGSAVTADDVKFTADYCMNTEFGCAVLQEFSGISSVEVVDPLTVKLVFAQPVYSPLQAFVGGRTPVLQKAQFEPCLGAAGASCTDQNFGPIGTGPFVVKSFVPGDVAQFEANPNYRDPAKPAFASVTVKGGGDAAAAARAVLETGEYDFAWNLQLAPEVIAQMEAAGKGVTYASFGSMVERIEFNQTDPSPSLPAAERSTVKHPHPFLTDPAVRKALSMALDRTLLTELTYGPAGKPTCTVVPVPPAYTSGRDECLTQDIAGANALLEEAGWVKGGNGIREKDGVALKLVYQTTSNAVRQDVQALAKQWWSEIGVEAELKVVDGSSFFGGDPTNPDSQLRFLADAQMYTDAFYIPDPATFLSKFTCARVPSDANQWQGNNSARICLEEYDAKMAELNATGDVAKRQELAKELTDILTADGNYFLPLIHRGMVSGKINSLEGTATNGWEGSLWNVADWSRAK